jgi:hypothetical protein
MIIVTTLRWQSSVQQRATHSNPALAHSLEISSKVLGAAKFLVKAETECIRGRSHVQAVIWRHKGPPRTEGPEEYGKRATANTADQCGKQDCG